jgi:hypothetical protein
MSNSSNQIYLSSHNARSLSNQQFESNNNKIIQMDTFIKRCEKELESYNDNDLQLKINKCVGITNNDDIKSFNKCRNNIEQSISLKKFDTTCSNLHPYHKELLKDIGFKVKDIHYLDLSIDDTFISWKDSYSTDEY